MNLPLAAVPLAMTVVMVLWILSCLALVFIIMIQKGKGGGLSAAFGGGTTSLFGTKTGDFLTWVTIGVAGVFLLLSVFMGLYYKPTVTVTDTMTPAPASAPADSQPQIPAGEGAAPAVPQSPVSQ